MIDFNRVRKGDVLISEEFLAGQERLFYGPVVIIDHERKEVAIKMGEDARLFPVNRLWTIPSFLTHKTAGQQKIPIGSGTKVLAGFIANVLTGNVKQGDVGDILELLKKRGITPVRTQEALEVLMNM